MWFLILFFLIHSISCRFEPNWDSLDKRKSPEWYDEAKIGIFIHWGLYAVPSFGGYGALGEWFWHAWKSDENPEYVKFMKENYPPGFSYPDFAPSFRGEFFNATEWADIVEQSGAKYFVVTSKHHDGFTMWPSNVSWNWNAVDNGPHRDVLQELSDAFKKKSAVKFGLYYSLYEWYNRLYLLDKANHFTTQYYVNEVMLPQMYDYVTRYKPEYIWSDGDWEAGYEYWKSEEFLAWLYNDSPVKDTVLVNDRWGVGTECKHGDVKTCGIDRFNPHKLQHFKWENAMTIDQFSWGYRRNAHLTDYLTMHNLTSILAETISTGGNLIMNVGPSADGRISPIFEERLKEMGRWLKVNGEGIYGTKPWRVQNDTAECRIWYTRKRSEVYAIVLDWPIDGYIHLTTPITSIQTVVTLLGHDGLLPWLQFSREYSGIMIDVRGINYASMPCNYAWVFKLTGVE